MTEESTTEAPIAVRKVPKNIIVPEKKVDEWTRKIDGMIVDLDMMQAHLDSMTAIKLASDQAFESAIRWNLVRDCLMILVLAAILGIIGFNTTQLWHW